MTDIGQDQSEAQRKPDIIIGQPRQGLSPFQLIFTPSADKESDEYNELQWDWEKNEYVVRGEV